MLEPQGLTKRHEEKGKTAAPVVGVGGKGATLSASVCQHALHVRTSLHAKRLAAIRMGLPYCLPVSCLRLVNSLVVLGLRCVTNNTSHRYGLAMETITNHRLGQE